MERELASISKHDVYELVPAPKGRKIIGSMWVFKVKPDGLFKSRFCAQGFSQVVGTDFGSTYDPVCRIPSVRIVFAIAASHDWNVIQLDVQTAFLQSEMKEEVYVKQPVGFEKLDLNGQPYVCKLKKRLYEIQQSPRNWHGTIQHELITEGFKACMCDPCVYVKNDSSSKVFIVLYVDDLLVTGSSEVGISKTKAFLMTNFAMKDLGNVSLILGMQVSRDRLKGTLDINQGNYANAILQRYGFVHNRSVSTPGTGKPLEPNTRNSAG